MIRLLLLALILQGCAPVSYYIVRHAEKAPQAAGGSSDVPLSAEGAARAEALRDVLAKEGIKVVYTTPYQRTRATAAPVAKALNLTVQTYTPGDTAFIANLKGRKRGNVLIVGHSNTVDDLVAGLLGERKFNDLPDSQYGDLFIVRRKGTFAWFDQERFGKP